MIGTVLLVSLALGQTAEEAAQNLRVAWASQYEWREDKIESVVLDFTYAGSWKGNREGEESRWSGGGQILVVGNELVRGHYPGADESRRKQLHEHLTWVASRFVRRPFEEHFKDAKISPAEPLSDGSVRIKTGTIAYLLKSDRLIGAEVDVGTPPSPS
ncbi:MAG: hypothetical protein HC813_02085 [Planctomycetes bacterium]|nr:hypothetical protein [Planctomycetota bacterium]